VGSKLEDGQCGFRPGRSIFEKSWEYGKDLFACFVELEKKHMTGFLEINFGGFYTSMELVVGQLLLAIKSFCCQPQVCVRVNDKQSKPIHVGFGLRQGCILSPLLFIIYMNWIDKLSQTNEYATIGNCKINRLLFAKDLVLLSSTESGLQRALNDFAAVCDITGMKISTTKTEYFIFGETLISVYCK